MTAKITTTTLRKMKTRSEPIACLTAYDAGFAGLLDSAGVDCILVGDSLGMTLHGAADTLGVTLADMIYHSRLVSRARPNALIVTDMSYQTYMDPVRALENAGRLVQDGGAEVVKLEGGAGFIETVTRLVDADIPVCGHLGLLPQSIHELGGYRIQGRDADTAQQIFEDAQALAAAGAVMLVLECVPATLAGRIRGALDIPVIGIGAGPDCDGQVLVLHDMLGISAQPPGFSRDFLAENGSIRMALKRYVEAVKSGEFPDAAHTPAI